MILTSFETVAFDLRHIFRCLPNLIGIMRGLNPTDYRNIDFDKLRVSWGGLGFPPYDRMNEKDFWKLLRETRAAEKAKTDKALLIGVGCNLFEWGTFLRI